MLPQGTPLQRLRRRLSGYRYEPHQIIHKTPIVLWKAGDWFLNCHVTSKPVSRTRVVPMMHFKFTADLGRKIEYALATGGYNQGSRSYRLYATLIERMREADASFLARCRGATPAPATSSMPGSPDERAARPAELRLSDLTRDPPPSHLKVRSECPGRRSVLALTASLLGLPLAAGPAAAFAGLAAAPVAGALRPEVRRYGRFFIVNGWVLTADDLERLGLHAA